VATENTSVEDEAGNVARDASAGDITMASYEAGAEVYRQQSSPPAAQVRAYLDQLADLVDAGTVLEIGSGPGRDAAYLESRGPRVIRTDAVNAFVELLRADGYPARLLDVRVDDLGGPYDAVLADAVLLHLSRAQFVDLSARARDAVADHGVLAFTVKEGDGDRWSHAKLGLPRHFTYWRETDVRRALENTGWRVLSLEHVIGRVEPWLFVLARAGHNPGLRVR
jgi:SAM-dependent methyltransferase